MKKIYSLAVITLGLCFSNIGVNYAQSSELQEKKDSKEILFSQLKGHEIFNSENQVECTNYTLGRVVGKSGDKMSILTEDGVSVLADGYVRPGSNVLVAKDENAQYYLVDASHSEWISRLEDSYGLKRNPTCLAPLAQRTAGIWAEIEASRGSTINPVPRREPVQRQYQIMESEPVRGLW